MGLDVQDVVTITDNILSSIREMSGKGLRIPPVSYFGHEVININNSIPGKLDCGAQADYTIGMLDKLKRTLNDTWEFNIRSGFAHAWGIAVSSNPNDPVIWFDPRAGTYSIGAPCPTCKGFLGHSYDKFMDYDVDIPPRPKAMPKNWR